MKNSHLIPQIINDCVDAMLDEKANSQVRFNFEERVKAVREYCDEALKKYSEQRKRK